jgi:hypothetical protein
MKEILRNAKLISFASYTCFATRYIAGRIARELWWTNQEFSPLYIIPPWFSILMYRLGDEQ